MATIDIYNLSGAKVGTMDLADEVFGAVNEDLLWEAIKHYRASRRAGTHATKNRGSVSGSGKKLWKQKGTGRARIGSIRSPLWRHGGTVHGPQPRSYDYAFPRKKLLGALRSALAAKLADGKLMVVKSFEVKEPKTKLFRESLDKLKVEGTTLLVEVSAQENRNLELSSRLRFSCAETSTSNVVPSSFSLSSDSRKSFVFVSFTSNAFTTISLPSANLAARAERSAPSNFFLGNAYS